MADDRIDLVIFDCDGVLVDSERLAVRVDALMLAELGWPLTEAEIVERFVGRSHRDLTAAIEQQLGRPLPEGWYDRYRPWYRSAFEAELTAVDGIIEALGLITLPSCVASSNTHPGLRHSLGLTGLYSRFEGRIFSASEVEHGKPAPDLFLHAARALGADPARCVVVEDSRFGVEAARAAGMRAFGYYGGLTPRAWLEGPGTVVFDEMRDLPELLLGGF
ncbi:HAD family hydrolase [Streptomyces fildesensis]|uniref:HAD family hydrolase n=1 Tax=Streptomyces fildesensis TaxID=375757 RepID=A0ABW8C7M5_9ACTN